MRSVCPNVMYEYNLKKIQHELLESTICLLLIPTLELYYGFVQMLWRASAEVAKTIAFDGQEYTVTIITFIFLFDMFSKLKHLPFAYYQAWSIGKPFLKVDSMWDWIYRNAYYRFPYGIPLVRHLFWFTANYYLEGTYILVWVWLAETLALTIFQECFEIYLRGYVLEFPHKILTDSQKSKLDLRALKVMDSFTGIRTYNPIRYRQMVLLPPSIFCIGLSNDSLASYLKNELAHIKLKTVVKKRIIERVTSLVLFYCLHICSHQDNLFISLGLCECYSNVVRWMIIDAYVFPVALKFINFFRNYHSRKEELKVDKFTKQLLGHCDETLEQALLTLDVEKYRYPYEDHFYAQFNKSTPLATQRVTMMVPKCKNN